MAEAADFTEAVVEKADNHESGVWPIASCRYRLRLGNGWYALVNESIVNGQRALVYAHIPYRARWDFFFHLHFLQNPHSVRILSENSMKAKNTLATLVPAVL